MIRYLVGRLLQVAPVLLGISIIVFLLVRLIPGDPAIALLGSRATPELVARVHDQLGLDLPIWQQYLTYIGNALQGDFGISFFYQAPVWEVTVERFPLTHHVDGLFAPAGERRSGFPSRCSRRCTAAAWLPDQRCGSPSQ